MAESTQYVLSRVRPPPPRVQITYDVEIGGAIEKKQLPFIAGILADLPGQPSEPLPKIKTASSSKSTETISMTYWHLPLPGSPSACRTS